MLFVANFPAVVIFFFGVFAYFLWKTFSQTSEQGIRQVFEFYLSANEILRDDERKWFGFEVSEVIMRGEQILQAMHGAPPLVYFTLGALYNKVGNHEAAVNNLSYVVENDSSGESTYVHPSVDLRSYVKVLRKIEREPTEAPQTSAAIRSLERARRNRGEKLLEESRLKLQETKVQIEGQEHRDSAYGESDSWRNDETLLKTINDNRTESEKRESNSTVSSKQTVRRKPGSGDSSVNSEEEMFGERKPITEVLHDIYDKNIQ